MQTNTTKEQEALIDFHDYIGKQIATLQMSQQRTSEFYTKEFGPFKPGDTIYFAQPHHTENRPAWAHIEVSSVVCTAFPVWFRFTGVIIDCNDKIEVGREYSDRVHAEGDNWHIITPEKPPIPDIGVIDALFRGKTIQRDFALFDHEFKDKYEVGECIQYASFRVDPNGTVTNLETSGWASAAPQHTIIDAILFRPEQWTITPDQPNETDTSTNS